MGEAAKVKGMDRLLTIDDLNEITKIPKSTLKLYVAEGEIPSYKIGRHRRFDQTEIRKWLKKRSS